MIAQVGDQLGSDRPASAVEHRRGVSDCHLGDGNRADEFEVVQP
ncbi:MAG: hypothetical protein ABJA11_10420 [Pseudolysinimonas sp.]